MLNLNDNIKYLVIGNPIAHSKSPEMQNAVFEHFNLSYRYEKIKLELDELQDFCNFAKENLLGFNITVPFKSKIIKYLDFISDDAKQKDSVNTVKIIDGKLYGYSTDGFGLEMAIKDEFNLPIENSKFLFIGLGGASQAAVWHFASCHAKQFFLANRTMQKTDLLANQINKIYPEIQINKINLYDENELSQAICQSDCLIQGTSLGLKTTDALPFNFDLLLKNSNINIYDLIYNNTPLITFAKNHHIKNATGASMLAWQGAKSFEIWQDKFPPINIMKQTLL